MNDTFICPTCGKRRPESQRVSGERLRSAIRDRIRADLPEWDGETTCRSDVHKYRIQLLRETLEKQRGPVGNLDASVLERMANNQLLARNLALPREDMGARVADAVASFGGSWTFMGIFGVVLALWMIGNVLVLTRAFDPYPFILLNLVLSCLAAVQAPVIMMSQNRQAAKDRERAEHDYEVNLKAELEVQLLHEKLDQLIFDEWQDLLESQAVQIDMLEDLTAARSRPR